MNEIALVRVTFADAAEAERIARTVIAERLAACVNIEAPCRSIYHWQGRIEEDDEVPALFKTRPMLVERLSARIAELHGYDLPVVEHWRAGVLASVTAWVSEATG